MLQTDIHTLDRSDIEQIRKAAEAIPPIKAMVRKAVKGKALLDMGMTSWCGQNIDPARMYVHNEDVEADRFKLLKDAIHKHGMDALDAAVRQLRSAYINVNCELRFIMENGPIATC